MRQWYQRNYFFIRRLHSLLGIVPVGAFFLVHMLLNSRAAQSPEQYQWVPDALDQIPYIWAIELGLIIAPIVFHGMLGALIVWQGDPTPPRPALSWYASWAYLLQRYTGVALFLLLAVHLAQTWWQHWQIKIGNALHPQGKQEFQIYAMMNGILQQPVWLVIYILFVLIAAYHFGNGIYNFAYKWGVTTSKSSQRFAIGLGLLAGLLGVWMGMVALWGLCFSPWAHEAVAGGVSQWFTAN
jgi:succinate dehydrogenase / fumarate reductase, cytochrome b subunit